jgi:hypothetical protein
MSTTQNGATTHATTENPLVDFFFAAVRNIQQGDLVNLLEKAWNFNPVSTMILLFYTRDCRGGKGEREIFYQGLRWLSVNHPTELELCFELISEYGLWKDYLSLLGTAAESSALDLMMGQMLHDQELKEKGQKISLAAKWAPTEGCSFDKKYQVVHKLCQASGKSFTKKQYRKLTTVLRNHLKIVESQMSAGNWDDINLSTIPSIARKRYVKALTKHIPDRYEAYLKAVAAGEAKMNVGRNTPHELLKSYINGAPLDTSTEVMWNEYVKQFKEKVTMSSSMAIVDVSGSMTGQPLEVAVSLGLLLSEINLPPFGGRFITFSESPQMVDIEGTTIHEKVTNIKKSNWGGNTDLIKSFKLLLELAVANNVPKDSMVKTLYIFSDMEFDVACSRNDKTNFQVIEEMYEASGYERPRIVFWNLTPKTANFPVCESMKNVALVSGFSPDILDIFLTGKEMSPLSIVQQVLDKPRYDAIRDCMHQDDETYMVGGVLYV